MRREASAGEAMKWNRAQAELVIAWALYEAGVISLKAALAAWDRAGEMAVFRCQDIRNWPDWRANYRCFCGEPLPPGQMPVCWKCAAEKNQIYHNHKRRVFLHN